jgi:hypothetical protein
LLALKAHIARQLASDEEFELPCDLDLGDDPDDSDLRGWCIGFMEGVFLREEAWFETAEDEVSEMLLPIMVGSGLFDEQPEFADIAADANLMDDMIVQIPEALTALYLLCNAPDENRRSSSHVTTESPAPHRQRSDVALRAAGHRLAQRSAGGDRDFPAGIAHHPLPAAGGRLLCPQLAALLSWLVQHPRLGPWIRDYLDGNGIPLKGKVYAIGLMWAEHRPVLLPGAAALGTWFHADQRGW